MQLQIYTNILYTFTYVFLRMLFIHAYLLAILYTNLLTFIDTLASLRMLICEFTNICLGIHVYISYSQLYTNAYIHILTYFHLYMYSHIHTHSHIRIQNLLVSHFL